MQGHRQKALIEYLEKAHNPMLCGAERALNYIVLELIGYPLCLQV
jgi:hypothetical protein